VGCNFTPSTAINQLEMWQAETFDPATCERELGWAAALGMNGVRVFLHDLAWQADPEGFKARVERFLSIASGCGIATLLVIFDDCWFPPRGGRQPEHFVLPSPSLALLRATFEWARAVDPVQPLTAALWGPAWSLNRFQLAASDIVTFHQYAGPEKLEERIRSLQRDHRRPVLCTEWMARPHGSRFETHLPIFRDHRVGCYCWGLVAGKTQTIHGWNDRPGTPEPAIWHHDVLRADGSPHDPDEVETIRRLTRG
jgi:hypothetical protein